MFSEIFYFDVWAGQGKSEREALPSHMRSQSVECDGKKRGREKKPIAIGSIGSEPSNSSIYTTTTTHSTQGIQAIQPKQSTMKYKPSCTGKGNAL